MKKIIAVLLALLMMAACAAEEPEIQSSAIDGNSSEPGIFSEESEETSQSSQASHSSEHSSQQSGDPAFNESVTSSGSASEKSGIYSETSSAPELVSSNPIVIPFIPGTGGSVKNAVPIENTYVKRADARVPGGEDLIRNFAVNRRYAENGDKLLLLFNSAKSLKDFVEKAGNVFQLGEGEGSFREKLLSYDDDYFYNNTLLIAYLPSSSGSIRYEVAGYVTSGSEFHLCIKAKMPEVGTADMADYFAVAECSHNQLNDSNVFAVDISF